jgi:serine/threonine protein kinase/Tol biopolymer transport system component
MDSERERQITSIFHSAVAREPHERAPYLDGACGDDEALRREVEELIKSHESAGSFIASPAYEQSAELLSTGRVEHKRAGQSIGPYKIISLVGAGGMGEVYRAHDSRLGREVALKLLPDSLGSGTDGVRRFQQEARAASALNHANILAIYDIGEHEGSPYIVSELLEGETLREKLSGGPLAARKALDYALQTARGLAAAHDKGIVHRDLKPDNLFVTKDGRVKILDFGIAKLVPRNAMRGELHTEAPTMMVQTDPGMVIGTAGYMSPEQVRGQTVDTRSDIFSFGAILYETLSGKRAFHGASPVETMNAILKEEPAELSSTNSQISPSVERVVRRCLEKQPHERFQSASDLAFAVESLLGGAQSSGVTNAVQSPDTSAHGIRRTLRTQLGWIVAGLFLLSALTFAILYFRRAPDQVRTVRFAVGIPDAADAYRVVEMQSMAVSPDGRHLAFIANAKAQRMIWVRPLDAMSAAPLPGTESADSVFWSPDSRRIGFFAEGKLKRIEVDGKSLQTVCNLSAPMDATASWGLDGTIIFSEEESGRIYRVSSAGGAPSLVVEGKGRARRWIHFLPDGRRFLFYKHDEGENNRGIYAGALDSKDIKQVASIAPTRVQYVKDGYLLYVREGSLVARTFDEKNLRFTGEPVAIVERLPYFDKTGWAEFSASEDGVLVHLSEPPEGRLVWLDRGGREIGQAGEPGHIYSVRLSPDGQKAAVDMINAGTSSGADIWIQDLERDTRTLFVSGPTDDDGAVWSADGRRLAYFSCCDDASAFHIKELGDTGKGEVPVKDQDWAGPIDWSRDGRFILYWAGDDAWVLPVASGEKPYQWMTLQPKQARFSPDGRWVAFVSDETGRPEVYVTRFDRPGEKWRVSTEGGLGPRWRGDGKELFYLTQDFKVMSVQVKSGEQFDAGSPAQIFRADPLSVDYDVAADGQRFIFVASLPGTQFLPFAVVVNWNANLKR